MSSEPRTYGNWQRPRTPGIGELGIVPSTVVFGGAILTVLTMLIAGPLAALAAAVPCAVFVIVVSVSDEHGRSLAQRAAERAAWWRTRRSNASVYSAGPTGVAPLGTCQLPGIASRSKLAEAVDAHGNPFALVHLPARHVSVTLRIEPDGETLVDDEQVDAWVAQWGQWLANLGREPGLVAAAVTIESAPDTGARLADEVGRRLDPGAPQLAREVLHDIVATYPNGGAVLRGWIQLTYETMQRGKRLSLEEMAGVIAMRLPQLSAALTATGAGNVRPATGQDLCEIVRVAYDPAAERLIDAVYSETGQGPQLRWSDVGPTSHKPLFDRYHHDGATSVVWSMTAAPRGLVHGNVIAPLLAPHPDIARKRVTLLYKALSPARSAAIVEADQRTAHLRAYGGSGPTNARAKRAADAADASAHEEAAGAAIVEFGMVVSATVEGRGDDEIEAAVTAVENLAGTASVALRRTYSSQDSSFLAGLPVGVVLAEHVRVPRLLREGM